MSVLKPRTRQLYFRVSEEEFERFRRIQTETRARSLSDLIRNSLERLSNGHEGDASIRQTLASIGATLVELDGKVEQLALRLTKSNGEHSG
ncbi:MAG TPA: hypothetical protein VE621_16050 [Bryobacteraceae bacterium]|nr:hypothetical protein [Bryobacteraceae bacterium]